MLEAFVVAGFNPSEFWRLTPREWSVWMVGARSRRAAEKNLMAVAAWVGTHADYAGLEKFLSSAGGSITLPPEALDRMLSSVSVGLPQISLEEYLARHGRMN